MAHRERPRFGLILPCSLLLSSVVAFGQQLGQPQPYEEPPPAVNQPEESIWTRTLRRIGLKKNDPTPLGMMRGADGKWQAVTADRISDRETNADYQQAEDLIRKEEYRQARRLLKRMARQYKDQPLEEDILFLLAEAEFQLDWLPSAQDSYHRLLTKYPTTRYMPQAVQRTYDIAYYWLEDARRLSAGEDPQHSVFSRYVNFFDKTRPAFDIEGRAIDAIEVIQQYDPFGPLTDDAVMMAGGQNFITDRYIQAAGYYEQLSIDQPQSEHASKAVLLGAEAYRRSYRGPQYDETDLEGAKRMTQAAASRSSDYDPDQLRRLDADLRVIHIEKARRDFEAGEDYRRRGYWTSAKFYYREVIKRYADTDWARRAEERLEQIGDKETKHIDYDWYLNPVNWFREKPADSTGRTSGGVGPAITDDTVPGADVPSSPPPEPEAPREEPTKKKSMLGNWLEKL